MMIASFVFLFVPAMMLFGYQSVLESKGINDPTLAISLYKTTILLDIAIKLLLICFVSDFDTFASVTAQSLASDVYQGLVSADTDIALHGGVLNGFAVSPQMKGILLAATDDNNRPLFINSVSEGAVPMILGAPTKVTKAAFVQGSPNTIGVAGDWSQAMYGTVEGVKIDYSSDATLDLGGGSTINLFQQNMFAVRAEIEVGFRADTSVFNKLTASTVPSI